NNATLVSYAGTIAFSSADVQASVPPNYTFVAGDNGVHTFSSGVTLKTAGIETVTAAIQGASISTTQSVTVSPADASNYLLAGPSVATRDVTANFTLTAKDPYGNVATGYLGMVHFSSSDGAASLPLDTVFLSGDKGVRV